MPVPCRAPARSGRRDRVQGHRVLYAGRPHFSVTLAWPQPDCRTSVLHPPPHESRKETRWRLAVPRGGWGAPADRGGSRRVRLPAAAAICDGARSSNDYSSGRRILARLETAAGFRSPQSTDAVVCAFTRTAPRTRTFPGATRFPVMCMPHRLRTAKTCLTQNFTLKSATRLARIADVTPFTLPPLVARGGAFYRSDVSTRYISVR